MMFDPSSILPDSANAIHIVKTAGAEFPDLTASPSRTPPGSPTFYLAPSIVQAMQHMPPAEPDAPNDFRRSEEPLDSDIDTFMSDCLNKLIGAERTAKGYPNKTFTPGVSLEASQQDPDYDARHSLRAQEQSSGLDKQVSLETPEEKEADTRMVEKSVPQVVSSQSDFRNMKNMLAVKKFQLGKKHRELELTQESNALLRTRLFDAKLELAKAQKKLGQKEGCILACDKKIDALQKTLLLLTPSNSRPTAEEIHTGAEKNPKAESGLPMYTSKSEKMLIPPSQPSEDTKSITRSSDTFRISTRTDIEVLFAREREARLEEAQLDYEALLKEKEAFISQVTKQSYESRAQLEDRYMLGALSEKLRRLIGEIIWDNRELDMENDRLRENNEKLREELKQAKDAKNSGTGHVCVPQQTPGDTLARVSQHEDSETGASAVETERTKDAVGDGHEGMGLKANSPLSQGFPCGSDWASVERPDIEKE